MKSNHYIWQSMVTCMGWISMGGRARNKIVAGFVNKIWRDRNKKYTYTLFFQWDWLWVIKWINLVSLVRVYEEDITRQDISIKQCYRDW